MASTPSSARWASELPEHLVAPRTCSAQRTVHPQVIDGVDSTLDAMERVPVNAKNRPLNEIRTTHVRNQPSTPGPPAYRERGRGAHTTDHVPYDLDALTTVCSPR